MTLAVHVARPMDGGRRLRVDGIVQIARDLVVAALSRQSHQGRDRGQHARHQADEAAAHSAGLVILSQVNGSPRLIFRAFLTEEPKKLPCARGLRRRIAAKVGARTENPYEPAADPDTRGRPRSSGAVAGFELRSRDRGGKADGARSDSAPNDAAARDAAHRNDVCRDRVLLAILA